ncbi:MAG: SDR family NAD(P)-dependent oxidoreductase [Clostridiales bacterium]
MNMKDKTVLITGAGRGIGLGIATAFAKEGANIAITDIVEANLKDASAKLEKLGVKVLPLVVDGADENAVSQGIDKVVETFGGLDVLINNAQASKSGVMLVDHTKADFDLAINTGLYATFFFMRAAFPHLKATKGSVINFASGAGINGRLGQSSYAASKEGIRGLTRVAANEWGEFGIRANVVCPLVKTEALAQWEKDYPEIYEKTIQGIPLRRFGDAEKDIGRVCVFLASDDASYISGETISLQGASGMRP